MTETLSKQQAYTQQQRLTVKRIHTNHDASIRVDVNFGQARHTLTFGNLSAIEAFCDDDDALELSQLLRLAIRQLRREGKGLGAIGSVTNRTFTIKVSSN